MTRLVSICAGGAVGSGARYLVSVWATARFGTALPYGTLIVNLTGCFIIAAIMHVALSFEWSPTMRLALTVGFVGGLTTYSSFNQETWQLIESGAAARALANVALTLVGGLAAGWLGLAAARAAIGR